MRLAACFFVFCLLASGLKTAKAGVPNPTPSPFGGLIEYSPIYSDQIEKALSKAISSRLGLPYRYGGTDDSGYDCSGFVWSVFREAGFDFSRTSSRNLWQRLPEATVEESTRFGTLVFFQIGQGVDHVGIVRDADSFYHASNSGVMLSRFDNYWGSRVIGYRRVFAPIPKRAAIDAARHKPSEANRRDGALGEPRK